MKVKTLKIFSTTMASMMVASLLVSTTTISINATDYKLNAITQENVVSILESKGDLETASVNFKGISGASGYNVYYKLATDSDSKYKQIDNELIRQYPSYFRADVLGLSAGNYVIKVVPVKNKKEYTVAQSITSKITVKSHTREGFAFSNQSQMKTSSGGYNDNGTIKSNSQIIYINSKNVNTVKLDVITNSKGSKTTCTGLVDILAKRQKGYDKTPLIIRMIGQINDTDIKGLNSSGYLQLKGIYNTTFEGIGQDATVYGWGFLIRDSRNIELRNVGIMLFKDDGISLDTGNENIWIHNNDIFYGAAGSDADQVKGDGSADVKGKSTYVTLSYNHFWDSGKASLCGMSDTDEFFVTYHHNWFDHSDSRHPRIRVGTVHIYNNYFDGNSKYGVGVTKGSSAFVEANDFRNTTYPMLSSLQGSDIAGGSKGTFSGEAGGMIKAYNNKISGAKSIVYANKNSKQFDAYLATSRNEKVPSSYKTVSGGNTYNNFDTNSTMYKYTPDNVENVRKIVTTYAGRVDGGDFKWNFTSSDDKDYKVNVALMNAIKSYDNKLVSIGGGSVIITPDQVEEDVVVPPTTPQVPEEGENSKPSVETTNTIVHNFTVDGKNSDLFNIVGNLSSKKGIVNYNNLNLKNCLKIESSTKINFKTDNETKLILVFNSNYNKQIKVDNKKYNVTNGMVEIPLKSGNHTITKVNSANLYYIQLKSK